MKQQFSALSIVFLKRILQLLKMNSVLILVAVVAVVVVVV
jgi:hypothetical protein